MGDIPTRLSTKLIGHVGMAMMKLPFGRYIQKYLTRRNIAWCKFVSRVAKCADSEYKAPYHGSHTYSTIDLGHWTC